MRARLRAMPLRVATGTVAMLLVAACGSGAAESTGQDTTLASSGTSVDAGGTGGPGTGGPATETDEAPPPPETGGTEKPAPPPPAKPSVNAVKVPIGGSADTEEGCVRALSFLGTKEKGDGDIPEGMRIVLGDFTIDAPLFRVASGNCDGGRPSCQGFVFRSREDRCNLAIERIGGNEGDTAELSVTSTVECQVGQDVECQRFADHLNGDVQTIELVVPPDETGPTTDTTTSGTSTSDTSTSDTSTSDGSTTDTSSGTSTGTATSDSGG